MQFDEIIADQHLTLEGIIKDYGDLKIKISTEADLDELSEIIYGKKIENRVSSESVVTLQKQESIQETKFTNEEIDQLLHQFVVETKQVEEQNIKPQYILDYIDQLEKEPYLVVKQDEEQQDLIKQYDNLKQSINTFIEVKKDRKQKELYELIKGKQTDLRIKCITCFSNNIAMGTSKGSIYIINDKVIKLESDQSVNVCPVVCLKFSEDGQLLIALTQQQLLLYYKNKFCKAFNKVFDGIPINMAMYSGTKSFLLQFITCDSLGKVQIVKIRKNLLTYGIETLKVFDGQNGICHQCDSIKNKELQLVALALRDSVFVILVEPSIELLFKKNYEVKKRNLICVKWQIESESPLLAISNGKNLEILMMQWDIRGGRLQSHFEVITQYTLNDDILYITWLSDNIIFIKHDRKRYSLLALSELLENKVNLIQSQMNYDFSDQYIGEDKIQSFNNTICQNHNQLFYIQIEDNSYQTQQIIHYQLISWQDYLKQLTNSLNWSECLAMCLYFYQGKQIKFAGLPRTDRKAYLRPYLNEKLKQFVEVNISHKTLQNVIPTAIEFLVSIESYDFLFRDIKTIFQKQNLEKQFYNSLEPFILKNCIKYIPDESLKDVMIYLLNEEKKLNTLKQLIINLDVKLLDPISVQQLCVEHNLFTLLIYISPRVDDDYKTPLFKMYAVYRQLIKKDQFALKKYLFSLQLKLKENENEAQSQIDREIQLLGYKCLWNLHMLIQGELFPQQQIPIDKWPFIMAEILSWLLQYDTLEEFYKIDPAIFFNELLQIFSNNSKYRALEQYKQIISGDQLQINDLQLSEIVVLLLEAAAKKLNLMSQLCTFIYEIMKLGYVIKFEHFMTVILHNFRDPYLNLKDLVEQNNYKFSNQEYIKQQEYDIQLKKKRDNVFIQYLNHFKNQLDQQTIKLILQESSNCIQSCLYIQSELYYIQGDWQKCLQNILTSNDQYEKVQVFNYIEMMLKSQKFEKEQILTYVLQIVPQLVSICAERLRVILSYYNEEDFKSAIDMLDSHPQLKFNLLYEIIHEKRQQKQLVEDKLMISFFKLICQLQPQNAYEQLQHGDFPQDECLKLCEKYNILKGIAYLKERSGRYLEAMNQYFEIISEELKKIMIIQYDDQTLTEQIQIQILPCIKICRESHQTEDESAELWFNLVIKMVTLRQQFVCYKTIFKSLNNAYQIMLEELLERVSLLQIIKNIKLLFGSFVLIEELRKTFTKLLSFCSFELYNQNQLNRVLNLDYIQNLSILHQVLQQGINFNPLCQTCDEKRDQYMLGFINCNHIFHYGCVPKVNNIIVCEICLNINSYRMKIQLESVVDKTIQKQTPQLKLKQQNIDEEEYTKEEIKAIRINKWKLHDIENEINEPLY